MQLWNISWTARILYYFYPFVIALCVDWVCNEHFLIVGIIKHWKSQCGKMQTWICHKSDTYRHMSEIRLDLHNFQTTVIFKISSFGNFVIVVLCYKALIACNKQWQKVYMPIRSQYTTWLPWRSILFCKHMHGFCLALSVSSCPLRGLFLMFVFVMYWVDCGHRPVILAE